MKWKCFASLILVLSLATGLLPFSVSAEEASPFTVTSIDPSATLQEGTDYTFSKNTLTIQTTKPVTVGMVEGVTTANAAIVINTAGGAADVTLNKVSVDLSDGYYALKLEGGNPCTLRLAGESTLKNTHASGSAITTYGRATSLLITAVDGSLQVSNTGANGAIYGSGMSDLTIDGNAVVNVNSANHVGINTCGMITVKGASSLSVSAKKDGIVAGNDESSGITIGENAAVAVTGAKNAISASGVYGQKINIGGNAKVTISGITDKGIENSYGEITISDNAVISVTGGDFGIFNNYYEKPLTISGKAQITLKENKEFGIKNDGNITISDNAVLKVSDTDEGVYSADGSIRISDKAQIEVTNCKSWGILGSAKGLVISDDVKIIAKNAGSALRTGSKDTSNVSISGNAIIDISDSEDGIQHSGKAGTTFEIKDNVQITIRNIADDAIYSSNAKTTISGNVKINVDGCATGIYNGAADDQTFDIKDNAAVTINATSDVAIDGYGTLCVSGNAVLKHTNGASKEYGSENDIVISENGQVTISAKDKKVLYGTYKVIPSAGKVFAVDTGKTAEDASTTYYNEEHSDKGKSTWYYFSAKSVDIQPAPEIVWPQASAITFGDTLNDSVLTSSDENGTFAWKDGTVAPSLSDSNTTQYEVVYTPNNAILYDYSGVELTGKVTLQVNEAVAPATENTEKVKDITSENVKTEDKTELEKAKEDLSAALLDEQYNEEEKKAIQAELDRIGSALEAIEKAAQVQELINKLPATVTPDDEKTVAAIEEAQKAYNALTEHEKALVGESAKTKLDQLTSSAVAYAIIKGNGSIWQKGSTVTLGFTANGAYSKFVGIQIDGKDLDKAAYKAASGSTAITLDPAYLETLSVGKHTISVIYTDGQADGSFHIEEKAVTPATGDSFHAALYAALLLISAFTLVTLVFLRKKTV